LNKQKFLELIHNYRQFNEKDLQALEEVSRSYPYMQTSRALMAKASYQLKIKTAQVRIKYAALFTPDRGRLKMLMENKIAFRAIEIVAEPTAQVTEAPIIPKTKPTPKPEIVQKPVAAAPIPSSAKPSAPKAKPAIVKGLSDEKLEQLHMEVELNLRAISENKQKYYEALSKIEKVKPIRRRSVTGAKASTKSASPSKKTVAKITVAKKPAAKATISKRSTTSAKKPTAKRTSSRKTTTTKKTATSSKPKRASSKAVVSRTTAQKKKQISRPKGKVKSIDPEEIQENQHLLDQIKPKSSRHRATKKQKNQIQIINDFIKASPSIKRMTSNVVKADQKQKDLSETSVVMDKNLVSENLANIFIMQGKTNKAIDIYKKLIWRFPQKKTYFANRIKELQK